jgi:hypothetical protein
VKITPAAQNKADQRLRKILLGRVGIMNATVARVNERCASKAG